MRGAAPTQLRDGEQEDGILWMGSGAGGLRASVLTHLGDLPELAEGRRLLLGGGRRGDALCPGHGVHVRRTGGCGR